MATNKEVWFAEGNTEKWFETEKEAKNYEEQNAIIKAIVATGMNEDAAKKIAKSLLDSFKITAKVVTS